MILIPSYIKIVQVLLIWDAGQFSVIIGHTWIGLTFEMHRISSQTTFLELVPITMAFAIWDSNLSGKRLIINTENEALVSILNLNTSKSKRVMYLLRQLVLQGLMLNIQFKAKHIAGIYNVQTYSLSRQQWNRFEASFPGANSQLSAIPASFLLMIYSLDPRSF